MKLYYIIVFCLLSTTLKSIANPISISFSKSGIGFPIIQNQQPATLCYDTLDAKVVGLAIQALAGDIQLICNRAPAISTEHNIASNHIIAGTIGQSDPIDNMIRDSKLDISSIKNKKECFIVSTVKSDKGSCLIIAGSDRRGTAYGIFHLSRLLGVSPFVWWADALPKHHDYAFVSGTYTSQTPSVEYRGIFINDEDWGLQPWAALHLDTDIKDIGPKTYAKVFELLLRLKANFIWPAMHPCTKAFYYYKSNPQIANDYAIIVGGSHCEPLLRNNVFEWSENFEHEYGHKPGEWRYDTNKEEIYRYWNDRIKEAVNYESVFTIGMRGVHDGSMPGPKEMPAKKSLLEKVIQDQRIILSTNFHKPADQIPQIFVPYKEVLSIYQNGLSLPDDITIIWPDDNHGYIRQLPNMKEQARSGGHGVYYHLSYWGSPADYLWLSSISPALISYELHKAYTAGAKKLWVFNVGDIKPAEAEIQYSLDLAWDIARYKPDDTETFLYNWSAEIFGAENARLISEIKQEYYALASAGKPEHLDLINYTQKDAEARLIRYAILSDKVISLRHRISPRLKNCYDELIWYPVIASKLMNEKNLLAKKSRITYPQQPAIAKQYEQKAYQAFDSIKKITDYYNQKIALGKWNGIMSWHPRNRPVFEMPATKPIKSTLAPENWLPKPLLQIAAKAFLTSRNRLIPGLGIDSNGLMLTDSAGIHYQLRLKPGMYKIVTKWLPAFDTSGQRQLNYQIQTGKSPYQTVNVHAESETSQWKRNVIYGYASGETLHHIDNHNTILTIRPASAGMIFNGTDIYPAPTQ